MPGAAASESSNGFFLGHGQRAEPDLDQLAQELARQGVLPQGLPEVQLVALAREVAEELQSSQRALDALGYSATGEKAVDDSVYLARLMAGRRDQGSGKLFELFTRRVQDKTFVLRGGVWVDQALGETLPAERKVVEAFSAEYFALLAAKPALAPYLALSTRLVVQLGTEVYEIVEPRPSAGG
jgi:hypothetical protein